MKHKKLAFGLLALLLGVLGAPKAWADTGIAVTDPQNGPFRGGIVMTPGTVYLPQQALGAVCTVAGNVSITFAGGSTIAWPVIVGGQILDFAATTINVGGTTATCTYYNMF